MNKVLLSLAMLLVSFSAFAQNYSFSITKSGTGSQSIIFIPGFACSGDVWKETVMELESSYSCYVLTMAGFSGTPAQENPSFESWKVEIAAFIQNERIEKPIIVGHSLGGGLALAIASDFPTLLKKIVVVDALPCLMALTNEHFKSVDNYDCSDMINRFTTMTQEAFTQMQKISVATLTIDSSKFNEILDWSLTSDRKTFAKIYCDFSNTDLRERIKNIRIPGLVLLEPNFKNIESAIMDQYKNSSTLELRYALKGLHFVIYDDKEWFINQLSQFVK